MLQFYLLRGGGYDHWSFERLIDQLNKHIFEVGYRLDCWEKAQAQREKAEVESEKSKRGQAYKDEKDALHEFLKELEDLFIIAENVIEQKPGNWQNTEVSDATEPSQHQVENGTIYPLLRQQLLRVGCSRMVDDDKDLRQIAILVRMIECIVRHQWYERVKVRHKGFWWLA